MNGKERNHSIDVLNSPTNALALTVFYTADVFFCLIEKGINKCVDIS